MKKLLIFAFIMMVATSFATAFWYEDSANYPDINTTDLWGFKDFYDRGDENPITNSEVPANAYVQFDSNNLKVIDRRMWGSQNGGANTNMSYLYINGTDDNFCFETIYFVNDSISEANIYLTPEETVGLRPITFVLDSGRNVKVYNGGSSVDTGFDFNLYTDYQVKIWVYMVNNTWDLQISNSTVQGLYNQSGINFRTSSITNIGRIVAHLSSLSTDYNSVALENTTVYNMTYDGICRGINFSYTPTIPFNVTPSFNVTVVNPINNSAVGGVEWIWVNVSTGINSSCALSNITGFNYSATVQNNTQSYFTYSNGFNHSFNLSGLEVSSYYNIYVVCNATDDYLSNETNLLFWTTSGAGLDSYYNCSSNLDLYAPSGDGSVLWFDAFNGSAGQNIDGRTPECCGSNTYNVAGGQARTDGQGRMESYGDDSFEFYYFNVNVSHDFTFYTCRNHSAINPTDESQIGFRSGGFFELRDRLFDGEATINYELYNRSGVYDTGHDVTSAVWFCMKLVFNQSADTYNVYIDGQLIDSDVLTVTGNQWVNNLRIYTTHGSYLFDYFLLINGTSECAQSPTYLGSPTFVSFLADTSFTVYLPDIYTEINFTPAHFDDDNVYPVGQTNSSSIFLIENNGNVVLQIYMAFNNTLPASISTWAQNDYDYNNGGVTLTDGFNLIANVTEGQNRSVFLFTNFTNTSAQITSRKLRVDVNETT